MEIRLHGRGGQGGVTCAKILASTFARLGKQVQAFGDYAGERSGAPVRAYTRVSDAEITNRNKVYRPDHLVVLDPHLLGEETVAGLAPGGTLLVNCDGGLESFEGRFEEFRLATVDATAIARSHGIGTRTVVIVNTTLAGAFAKVHGIPLEVLEASYRALGLLSNFPAACEAFEAVRVRAARGVGPDASSEAGNGTPPAGLAPVQPLTEHKREPADGTAHRKLERPAPELRAAPRALQRLVPGRQRRRGLRPGPGGMTASCRRRRSCGARHPSRRCAVASARRPAWRAATAPSTTARSTSAGSSAGSPTACPSRSARLRREAGA